MTKYEKLDSSRFLFMMNEKNGLFEINYNKMKKEVNLYNDNDIPNHILEFKLLDYVNSTKEYINNDFIIITSEFLNNFQLMDEEYINSILKVL